METIFANSNPTDSMIFQNIHDISSIEAIILKSHEIPQIIFKHSTTCPISKIAFNKMKSEYPLNDQEADLYYVGVIEQRPISNYISDSLEVQHESPQLIIIKNGIAIYNESHLMINPKSIVDLLA